MYDCIIIGAGVTGCAVARELSRYNCRTAVLEKEEDVCSGTSKANSAIVHAGYDAAEGSLMAKLNVKGNRMMKKLTDDLDVPYENNGSLVVAVTDEDIPILEQLYERGLKNGVEDMKIVYKDELKKMEKNLSDNVVAALYAKTAGIICPFNLNIALAENAAVNGAEFIFNAKVNKIEKKDDHWLIKTDDKTYETKTVVNAAGVYADVLHNMVSGDKIHITPRRGNYMLLDKKTAGYVKNTIFQVPGKLGKGVLVAPTVHGNVIVGPNAEDIDDKEATCTSKEGLSFIKEKASLAVKDVPLNMVITSFTGLRAHEDHHEFIIKELEDAKGFVDCAGIESPGLTSSPAIGEMVSEIVADILKAEKKDDFIEKRRGFHSTANMSKEELNELIKKDRRYSHIICRCEMVTEGEIVDCINRPVGARSIDGIKRRVRATAGRCQGGFCTPFLIDILSRELGIPKEQVCKNNKESYMLTGNIKQV